LHGSKRCASFCVVKPLFLCVFFQHTGFSPSSPHAYSFTFWVLGEEEENYVKSLCDYLPIRLSYGSWEIVSKHYTLCVHCARLHTPLLVLEPGSIPGESSNFSTIHLAHSHNSHTSFWLPLHFMIRSSLKLSFIKNCHSLWFNYPQIISKVISQIISSNYLQ
jgi:hypothetical protein